MSKSNERKSDLRNTTVMEVILTVIIILLCFIYMKDTDLLKVKSSLAILQETVDKQDKVISELTIVNRTLTLKNRDLERLLVEANRTIDRLRLMISPDGGGAKSFEDLSAELLALQALNKTLVAEIETLKKDKKDLEIAKDVGRDDR